MKQGPLTQTNKHKNYFLSTAKIMKSPEIANHTSKKEATEWRAILSHTPRTLTLGVY
jgi:hypothetical protein